MRLLAKTLTLFILILNMVKTSSIIASDLNVTAEEKYAKCPLLLVHGYLHNRFAWLYFQHLMEDADVGPIYTINLGSPLLSIEEYAAKVQKKAEQIAEETGHSDLMLIGHSMGGLVSAYYALYLASEGTVKSVTTLGSPMQGTKTADFGIGPSAKQMRYQSDFVTGLGRDISLSPIPFLHLGSKTDLVIRPNNSALLHGPNSCVYEFESMGHMMYLLSQLVVDKVVEFYRDSDSKDSRSK
jgi:predicted alpha/beta hydrolase family esterase